MLGAPCGKEKANVDPYVLSGKLNGQFFIFDIDKQKIRTLTVPGHKEINKESSKEHK